MNISTVFTNFRLLWITGILCLLSMPHSHAMEPDTVKRFEKVIADVNAEETRLRSEQYAYLKENEDEKDTLQEFLRKYASYARFEEPVSESAIEKMQTLSRMSFPPDLVRFYREHGGFEGGENLCRLSLYQPEAILRMSKREERYARLDSLGLTDMIRFFWGNDRPEIETGNKRAILSDAEIAYLNDHYTVVGAWTDAHSFDEAHHYIFFDDKGRFGILYVHQDEFDIFHLLKESSADLSWDAVVNKALDQIQADIEEQKQYQDDDDEEEQE